MSLGPKGMGAGVPGRFSLGIVAWAFLTASQVGCADNSDAREHANPTPAAAVTSGPSIPDPLATIGDEKITLGRCARSNGRPARPARHTVSTGTR